MAKETSKTHDHIVQVLASCGIGRDSPEYGLQFNLVYATVTTGLFRNGLRADVANALRNEKTDWRAANERDADVPD